MIDDIIIPTTSYSSTAVTRALCSEQGLVTYVSNDGQLFMTNNIVELVRYSSSNYYVPGTGSHAKKFSVYVPVGVLCRVPDGATDDNDIALVREVARHLGVTLQPEYNMPLRMFYFHAACRIYLAFPDVIVRARAYIDVSAIIRGTWQVSELLPVDTWVQAYADLSAPHIRRITSDQEESYYEYSHRADFRSRWAQLSPPAPAPVDVPRLDVVQTGRFSSNRFDPYLRGDYIVASDDTSPIELNGLRERLLTQIVLPGYTSSENILAPTQRSALFNNLFVPADATRYRPEDYADDLEPDEAEESLDDSPEDDIDEDLDEDIEDILADVDSDEETGVDVDPDWSTPSGVDLREEGPEEYVAEGRDPQ